jgi:hypothetical protein
VRRNGRETAATPLWRSPRGRRPLPHPDGCEQHWRSGRRGTRLHLERGAQIRLRARGLPSPLGERLGASSEPLPRHFALPQRFYAMMTHLPATTTSPRSPRRTHGIRAVPAKIAPQGIPSSNDHARRTVPTPQQRPHRVPHAPNDRKGRGGQPTREPRHLKTRSPPPQGCAAYSLRHPPLQFASEPSQRRARPPQPRHLRQSPQTNRPSHQRGPHARGSQQPRLHRPNYAIQ